MQNMSMDEDTIKFLFNETDTCSLEEKSENKKHLYNHKECIEIAVIAIAMTLLAPFLLIGYLAWLVIDHIRDKQSKNLEIKQKIEKAKEQTLFLKKVNQNNNSLLTKEEKKLKQRMLNKLQKKPKVPYINRDGSFNYNEYLMQGKNAKIDWSKFRDNFGYIYETSGLTNEAIYRLVKSRKFNRVECIQDKNLANLIINEDFSYIYNVYSDAFENDYFFTKKILERALKTGHSYTFIHYFKENYSMTKPIFSDLMIQALEDDNNIIHIGDIYYRVIDNFLQNEDFVRRYVNSYIEILNNYAEEYYDNIDNYKKINNKFEEAYREFEQARLLKLLPAKQDEAPIKTKKKI